MLSNSTSHSASAACQRPIRFRAACNLCCASKIKCSGERSGCERCRITGSQCVYVESRVGKVQGLRGKRRQSQPLAPRPGSGTSHRPITPAPSQASAFLEAENDDMLSWGGDLQLSSSNDMSDYMDDSTMSAMDFNLHELLQSPPETGAEMPTQNATPARQTMPLSLGLKPRSEQDSQCVQECCRIITDLESYIMADLKSFKILLGIIRKALKTQTTLIACQQGSRNLRCLFLFSTILYQILEMLELCVSNVRRDSTTAHTSILTAGSSESQLGFGDFSMDPEEQMTWRLQMILKEVNHAFDVIKKMKSLSGIGPADGAIRDSEVAESRENCYLDLELRFQDLSACIARLV